MNNDKVRICISAYLNNSQQRVDALFACVYSILSQTYQNFEIYIHHDGPLNDNTLAEKFRKIDNRITFLDNLEHKGHWGFFHRHNVSMIEPHADWVLYTNEDNYYVPIFLEKMIWEAKKHNTKMVYCDTLHSHFHYNVLDTMVSVGRIDMGSFISHMDLIKSTPWVDFHSGSDGVYAEKIGAKTTPIKCQGILFVHN